MDLLRKQLSWEFSVKIYAIFIGYFYTLYFTNKGDLLESSRAPPIFNDFCKNNTFSGYGLSKNAIKTFQKHYFL